MKEKYKELEQEKKELNLKRKELKKLLKELDFKIAKIERHQLKDLIQKWQLKNKN